MLGIGEFERKVAEDEARQSVQDVYRYRTRNSSHLRFLWVRLQSASRRAGGIGGTCRSYDGLMAWAMKRMQGGRAAEVQHRPGVEAFGDAGEPPASELAAADVVVEAEQQESSPPVTGVTGDRC